MKQTIIQCQIKISKAILYEEISKDPRETLRITALNCQEQSVPMEDVLTRLLSSAGAAPINRTVKYTQWNQKQ